MVAGSGMGTAVRDRVPGRFTHPSMLAGSTQNRVRPSYSCGSGECGGFGPDDRQAAACEIADSCENSGE